MCPVLTSCKRGLWTETSRRRLSGRRWLGPTSAQSRGIPEPEPACCPHHTGAVGGAEDGDGDYCRRLFMGASNCVVVADVRMMIPGGGGGGVCPTPLEMQICA